LRKKSTRALPVTRCGRNTDLSTGAIIVVIVGNWEQEGKL
jgi:hypothetical protein